MSRAIPDGYRSITPSFTFKDSQKAIDFYKKAFGAQLKDLLPNLTGKGIMHATIQIGDSILMMGDEMPSKSVSAETLGGSPMSLFLYVPNVDEVFQKAVSAGCKPAMPVMDMFWGDRAGSLTDPFGYSWMIATHTQDLTKEQVRTNAESFFTQWEKNKKGVS